MSLCWLHETAFKDMTQEAKRVYPLETGGILLGYIGGAGEPVVMSSIGPGPNATHSRKRFVPDHKWQCKQIDEQYETSAGAWVYLGDWHTHPNSSPHMSWIDQRTLIKIARHEEARLDNPLMIIGAGGATDWSWMCHQHIGEWLLNLLSRQQILHLKKFD